MPKIDKLFVLTLDQRGSRRSTADPVSDWVLELNEAYGDVLVLPFMRTVGDELQGVTKSAEAVVDLILRTVRERRWWLGVGIGGADKLEQSAALSRGPAFYAAREAVEAAKGSRFGFSVAGAPEEALTDLRAALELLAFVVFKRGVTNRASKRWEAVERARAGLSPEEIGDELGITRQSANARLLSAGWPQEQAGRRLAVKLLQKAAQVTRD